MPFNKQKTQALIAGTIMIVSQILSSVPMVNAQSTANAYTKCDEGIHPFDPSKPEATGSDADNNYISFPGEAHCNASLTGSFPNDQHVDPDPSTHNPKSGAKTVPKAVHWHDYVNESPNDGWYKRAWLQTFKIHLQPDLLAVLKPHTLYCPIPDDGAHYDTNFQNCDQGALPFHYENSQVFGGTSLDFDGTTLTYNFGLHQPVLDGGKYYIKPLIPGKNDSSEMPGKSGDPTTRWFRMGIDFETKDMSGTKQAWSASSTSEAYIIHTAIPVGAFDAVPGGLDGSVEGNKGKYHACTEGGVWNAFNSWCNVGGYNWVPLATVATVWKSTAPAPKTCTDFTLTPATLNNDPGANVLTGHVTTSDGGTHTATIKWTQSGGSLSSYPTQTPNTNADFTNTFTIPGPGGPATITAHVESIDGGVTIPSGGKCDQVKTIKPPPPDCTGLSITPPGPLQESDLPQTLTVHPVTTGGITLGYDWTSSPSGYLSFDGHHDAWTTATASTLLDEYSSLAAPVTVTVQGVNQADASKPAACKSSITIKPSPPFCKSLTFNKSTISDLGPDSISATAHYSDSIDRTTTVTWTPNSNTTITPSNPSDTHTSATPFSKNTNPNVIGNPVSLSASVTGVPAGIGIGPGCQNQVISSGGPSNACLNLNSGYTGPGTISGGTTVTLNPNPTYSTPIPHQVTWNVGGQGTLVGNPGNPFWCPAIMNNASATLLPGCTYFFETTTNNGDSGYVSMTAAPNLGTPPNPLCSQSINFSNGGSGGGSCTNLSWTPQPNNGMCVNPIPGGSYNGNYTWSLSNGSSVTQPGQCYTPPSGMTITGVQAQTQPQCSVVFPPNNTQCNYITPNYNGSQLCLNVNPSSFTGPFIWQIPGIPTFTTHDLNGLCQPVQPNKTINVIGPSPACSLNNYTTPPNPPQLVKTVKADSGPEANQPEKGGLNNPLTLIPDINGKVVDYKLIFTPTSPFTTATITDDISKGYIQGVTNIGTKDGKIVYGGSMKVTENGTLMQQCSPSITADCYTGDIGAGGITLVKVSNAVTIAYSGTVQKADAISAAKCQDNTNPVCQEKFPNTAIANYAVYTSVSDSTPTVTGGPISASALVQSFCQYILTRAAGDIYLETDLNFGKDISLCSQYKSSTGLLITPGPTTGQIAPSTGPGDLPIGHEICSVGKSISLGTGGNIKIYGTGAASNYLSSQICEVKLRPGESWSKSTITSTIKENKTRVARWTPNLNSFGDTISSFDDLTNQFGASTNVYHKTNGDLNIGNGQNLVLNDGQGAKTIIVEGHDLYIHNNITYGACPPAQTCNVRDTASLAFIVLGGNVYIDKDVTDVSGVFFVQQDPAHLSTGFIKAHNAEDSYTKITFYGSIYGDIKDLFTHHKYAGDPAANDGSVVIRFDERIILNTPPGLQDILQLNENQVAQ